tara:strand:+ start:509 stop:703 length:195 start_codon:yes stop_codon:yes gene_type:complete
LGKENIYVLSGGIQETISIKEKQIINDRLPKNIKEKIEIRPELKIFNIKTVKIICSKLQLILVE